MPRMNLPKLVRIAAVLVATSLVLAACDEDKKKPSETATTAPPEQPWRLVFLSDGYLYRFDFGAGKGRALPQDVGPVPTGEAAVSPDGSTYAFTYESDPEGNFGKRFGDPIIRVVGTDQPFDRARTLGRGEEPTWSPDGGLIAGVAVAEGYNICADEAAKDCVLANRVVAYDPAGGTAGEGEPAIGAGRWSILGWTGDEQILAAADNGSHMALGFPGAAYEEIARIEEPSRYFVFGVSPVEETLLYKNASITRFLTTERGDRKPFTRQGPDIDLTGFEIEETAWAPDGRTVAVVTKDTRIPTQRIFEVQLIDVDTGDLSAVPGSNGAEHVVWAADGSSFAVARRLEDDKTREALSCTLDGRCVSLFNATGPMRLIGLVPR